MKNTLIKALLFILLACGVATVIACSGTGNSQQEYHESPPVRRAPVGFIANPDKDNFPVGNESPENLDDEDSQPALGNTAPPLVLESWTFRKEHSFVIAEGRVTNATSYPIRNLAVIVQYFSDDGTFVKSSTALAEYNPIMPGQTSPFKTMETGNPAISKAHVAFKEFFGGTVSHTYREQIEQERTEQIAVQDKMAEIRRKKREEEQNRVRMEDLERRAPLAWSELQSELGDELTAKTRQKIRDFIKEFEGTKEGDLAENESNADGKWALVRQYEKTKNKVQARKLAKEIVTSFPDTISATLARKWLDVTK